MMVRAYLREVWETYIVTSDKHLYMGKSLSQNQKKSMFHFTYTKQGNHSIEKTNLNALTVFGK